MSICNEYASVSMENLHGRCPNEKHFPTLINYKGGGWDAQRQPKMQPSAEIVRVECAKCRRECDLPAARAIVRVECAKCRRASDLSWARATLCGDRACRVREMQARVRFAGCPRNLLHISCVSSARNAGESTICPVRVQPSAEIARVECAKCRRACDLSWARATLCGDRACRVREMQASVRFVLGARNPLRRSCVSSARNAGDSAICRLPAQPSPHNVRVECANAGESPICRLPATTLCGDRARRVREMQARVRFVRCARNPLRRCACGVREMQASVRFVRWARNPLRRSCVSSARNAGEHAICPVRAQPSAEIARVECAKCRRACDLSGGRATLCGDRACRVRENAGERAICPVRAQPSAEIARVECAKCRRACDLSWARATLCGDRACRARETPRPTHCRLNLLGHTYTRRHRYTHTHRDPHTASTHST